MDGILFPLLAAAAVTLLIVGGMRIVTIMIKGERRKLHQRLSNEERPMSGFEDSGRSITVHMEVTGLPPALAKHPFVVAMHKRVLQAYPDMTLLRFLAICSAAGVGLGLAALPFFSSGIVVFVLMCFGFYVPFFFLSMKR